MKDLALQLAKKHTKQNSILDVSGFIDDLVKELEAKQNEINRLSPLAEFSPNTISWIDSNMKYIGVNKKLADYCHLSQEDFKQFIEQLKTK